MTQIKNSNAHSKEHKFPLNGPLDGSIYRDLPENAQNELNISLNINTDGAPLVKSRHFQVWPVLASIIELNQSTREKFKCMPILAVWLHEKKPKLDKFFKFAYQPLVNLMNTSIKLGKLLSYLFDSSFLNI